MITMSSGRSRLERGWAVAVGIGSCAPTTPRTPSAQCRRRPDKRLRHRRRPTKPTTKPPTTQPVQHGNADRRGQFRVYYLGRERQALPRIPTPGDGRATAGTAGEGAGRLSC